jgi:hypothetical protein
MSKRSFDDLSSLRNTDIHANEPNDLPISSKFE